MTLNKYIPSGLNKDKWIILGIKPLNEEEAVIVMKEKGKEVYCTQYRGSGQYFDNLIDLLAYASKRHWTPIQIDERGAL